MAIDFPSSPTDGQTFVSGNALYTYNSTLGIWKASPLGTALPFNMLVCGSMQVSQQNGNTAGTTSGYYISDGLLGSHSTTGAVSYQRVQVVTPYGSGNRARISVTTAQATLTTNWLGYLQYVEGQRIATLQWGSASAKQAIARFMFKGPAGTWCFAIRNGANNRSYAANFTISAGQANTDTIQTIVIPGDTTGTWPTDNTRGMEYWITVASGTSTNGGSTTWAAISAISTASISNGLASTSNVFEVSDLGFYADPNNTGRAPPWEIVSEGDAMRESQRYWYKAMSLQGGSGAATSAGRLGHSHPVPMRIGPTSTTVGAPTLYDGTANNAIGALSGAYGTTRTAETDAAATGLTAGRSICLLGTSAAYIAQSARM